MAFSAGARACAAPSLLLLLLALLAATPAATVAWSQLGRTMSRERVTAISMDFGPDGFLQMRGHPKRVEMVKQARDPHDAARLWEISEKLTGVRYELSPA